jgi:nucleoside-diphosphate-sugar epimerase
MNEIKELEEIDRSSRTAPLVGGRIFVTGGSGFIGAHLVDALKMLSDVEVVNFDIAEPSSNHARWRHGDVIDPGQVRKAMSEFRPTHVVHLAARTDMAGRSIDDYVVNVGGTKTMIEVIAETRTVRRALFASTQYVCRPGHEPRSDDDYEPHTIYGHSKAMGEEIVRKGRLSCEWVIIRPTTIWGPGDLAYRRHFYEALRRGLYRHPRGSSSWRSYGFVGNVVSQICFLLECPAHFVDEETFYVGDAVMDIAEFVDAFSRVVRGRPAKRANAVLMRTLARFGDLVVRIGLPFPLTSTRYRSMTEDYPVSIERTLKLVGSGPYSLDEGVRETVASLRARRIL